MKIFDDAYHAAYQTLYEAKSVTCSVTGTLFDAVPAPCAVILDVSLPTIDRPFLTYTSTSSTFWFLNCMLLEQ